MTYFDWLSECVCDECQKVNYQKLFSLMFEMPFYSFVDNDKNRAIDGENLRHLYFLEVGLDADKDGQCSILEMLVGLSIRCENELMYEPDKGDRTADWFWMMMDNLGLSEFDDYGFREKTAWHILNRMVEREYERDGYGGPFYIPGCRVDLRKVELWYQLNYYLQENYPI